MPPNSSANIPASLFFHVQKFVNYPGIDGLSIKGSGFESFLGFLQGNCLGCSLNILKPNLPFECA